MAEKKAVVTTMLLKVTAVVINTSKHKLEKKRCAMLIAFGESVELQFSLFAKDGKALPLTKVDVTDWKVSELRDRITSLLVRELKVVE